MDNRIALFCGSMLKYENMCITVGEENGKGSNSLVYTGTYPDAITPTEKHIVLIKELFPLHPEGAIYRGDDNAIVCKPEGKELFNAHRRSFLAGNEAHLKMLTECPGSVTSNIISFYLNNTVYTLMDYTGGRSLEKEMSAPEQDLRRLAVRMSGLLRSLEQFHNTGYLHLDVAADNTLLIGQGDGERVVLIDYNSAWKFKDAETAIYTCSSIKYGYSAPEVRTGRINLIGPASDLYSVAALFYRCISGCVLTPFQMMRPTPPNVSQCPCLRNQPATVVNQVCRILVKGLQAHPEHRFRNCGEMAEAFQELIDRIDGKGISHWALWEAGQRTITRIFRDNTAMGYLKNAESQYPVNATDDSSETRSVSEWIREAVYKNSRNLIFTAPGGMGKTTALLRYIIESGNRFSAVSPAYIYIPLKRFRSGDKNFITDSILENLRFKNDVMTYETARHALRQIFSNTLIYKNEKIPSTVVFLDGLNEIKTEHQSLFDELAEFSQLPGIIFIATSRTYEPIDSFAELKITALSAEIVQKQLSLNGLLIPQDVNMIELLKTPLMLSIFIQASRSEEKQLSITNEDELIDVFFSSILNKEINSLSQDNDLRWQLEVAVKMVLPVLAVRTGEKGCALSDSELLEAVENCYDVFHSHLLSRSFKQWIGRSRAIIGEAKSSEEWYGIIVHSLLWQRLGLLVRDENGCYSIPHQILEEYLAQKGQNIIQRIQSKRRKKVLFTVALAIILIVAGMQAYTVFFAPKPYNDEYMLGLLSDAVNEYFNEGQRYRDLCELLDSTDSGSLENFELAYASYSQKEYTDLLPMREMLMESMKKSGEVCSWSGEPFDFSNYEQMCEFFAQRDEDYEQLTDSLDRIMHNEILYDTYYGTFIEQFKIIVETDADITSAFYIKVCKPHLTEKFLTDTEDGYQLNEVIKEIPIEQREHENGNDGDITKMLGKRNSAMISQETGTAAGRTEIMEEFK